MRNIWILISTLAIANLLAIGGFFGWLQSTNRLSKERMESVRLLFASTVAEEQRAKAEEDRAAGEVVAAQEQSVRDAIPPLTAEQKLAIAADAAQMNELQGRRFERDTSNLVGTLVKERADLERERAAFAEEVAAFEAMREQIAKQEGSEQFQKAVSLYQALKADQAKSMLAALIGGGGIDQVVSYLNALPARNSSKILAAFEADDPVMAADLLERLRKHGTEMVAQGPSTARNQAPKPPPEG